MESADPSAKKMRLPPAGTPVVDPAPGSAGRSGDPAPTGSQEPVESRADRISDLPDAVLGEIISLLLTKDCCRTQVLSIRWRPLWRAVPLNLDCRQLSLFNDFEIPRAIISSHQGSVQSLYIPSCYLSKHTMPCTVDAWLKSPEFTELQLLEFYYSPGNHLPDTERHLPVPSAPMSISRFSSSLHTGTFALCYLPDNLVLNLRLPFLKKLSLVQVRISEASLHIIIHSSCPALECLVLVFTVRIGCLQIKSPNLVRIGISFDGRQLIIQDAPSLQRLILDSSYSSLQITVLSAPKLETLGVIHDLCAHFNMVFGSTVLQVLYIIIYTCNHKLHFKFLRIIYISSWSTHFVLILCSMLNEEFLHGWPINGAGFCQDLIYPNE